MVGNSNDNTNFPHELLLTSRQVTNIRKAFAKNTATDIKLSKTQLSKMIHSGRFLGRLLGPLLKTGLPLMKSVIKPLAKSVLLLLGLTAAASAADAGIHKKILGSGHNNTTLIISNDEMNDILKIAKSLEYSGVLLKGVSETIQHVAYVINLDEYRDIGTLWVALYVNNKTVTYFDFFGVEHIPKEIMKFIGNKKIITNIYKIQAYDSIMCGYFCIGFIKFIFNGNSLTDYTSLFSPNNLKKNDDIILKYVSL